MAVVWCPIPLLSWLLPFIGHMGIGDSDGMIHDFAGPYYIGKGDMAFGSPTRYLILQPAKCRRLNSTESPEEAWDRGIEAGDAVYCRRMHNLCCDNCHSHVARCLNEIEYGGSRGWNMVWLAAYVLFFGQFTSITGALRTWLPFLVVVSIIVGMSQAPLVPGTR